MSNKYCKDCQHCKLVDSSGYVIPGDYSGCRHPINMEESLVTGRNELRPVFCEKMRRAGEACGPDALLFEQITIKPDLPTGPSMCHQRATGRGV